MKKLKSKKIAVAAGITAIVTSCAVAATAYYFNTPDSDPWKYALLSGKDGAMVEIECSDLTVDGNIRSNGNVSVSADPINISGYSVAAGTVDGAVSEDSKYENYEHILFPDVSADVIYIASSANGVTNTSSEHRGYSIVLDDKCISDDTLTVTADNTMPAPPEQEQVSEGKKIGAFGASFFSRTYSDRSRWERIFPVMYSETITTDSLKELGKSSNFIPLGEDTVGGSWKDSDKLAGAAISQNFSDKQFDTFLSKLKSNNEVKNICSDNPEKITSYTAVTDPEKATHAKSLVVEGANFTLDGNYEELEEIRLDNWGGCQLIGSFPKLKYIYKPSYSDLNLAGDFPELECVYMNGGQLLLGTGFMGFNTDGADMVNENGPIAIYTAKDTKITNSRIATAQAVLFRGAGADKASSAADLENSVFASKQAVMFEDMNDSCQSRYEKLPVFFSVRPMSVNNCNFKLMQGTYINADSSMILVNANIDKFRGYLFSRGGIDEYRTSSSMGMYLNTYGYNRSPEINNMNKQPNGREKVGVISDIEYADLPKELISEITDTDKFLNDLKGPDDTLELAETDVIPGTLETGEYILAKGDITISAERITGRADGITVIASEHGDITIDAARSADINAVIYAPCGNVTITGGAYNIKGRIFAENIYIHTDSFSIDSSDIDMKALGFVYNKHDDDTSSSDSVSSSDSSADSDLSVADTSSNDSQPDSSSSTGSEQQSSISESSSVSESSSDSLSSSAADSTADTGFTEPEYEYDSLNRLIKVKYDENNYIEYFYDANGNITKVRTVRDGEEV